MHAVVVDNVVKEFGGGRERKRALSAVSLRIERGAVFGLIGPNGAGKTTLLKTLLGVIAPSAGSVQVLGGSPLDPSIRARIGYLPERLALPNAWTAHSYLRSVARLKLLRDAEREVERQLARVGLASVSRQRIGTFSKGMRQRLGLASALLGEPELLVLDEPTDGIDPQGRIEVREILAHESRRGATLFLNSHLLAETERICNHVGFLVAGTLRRTGTMAELSATSERWRLRFSGELGEEGLLALGLTRGRDAGTWIFAGDAPRLNQLLQATREQGALLIELEPELHDLETLFLDVVERAS